MAETVRSSSLRENDCFKSCKKVYKVGVWIFLWRAIYYM